MSRPGQAVIEPAELPVVHIRPTTGWARLNLDELWQFRDLVYFLAWRDIKVRYKQTILGATWALLQPALTMILFTIFFGRLAKIPSDGLPYPIFTLAALVPWGFFSNGLSQAANSVAANQSLMTKVYFPRLALPISAVLSGVVDAVLSLVLLLALMLWYGMIPAPTIWALPLLGGLTLVVSLGTGLWLSAMNAQFRDVRHAVPFLMQAWLIATPIAYPSSTLRAPWRMVYALNPMVGVVEGFRWSLFGHNPFPLGQILVAVLVSSLLLGGGLAYYRRMERTFADIV